MVVATDQRSQERVRIIILPAVGVQFGFFTYDTPTHDKELLHFSKGTT